MMATRLMDSSGATMSTIHQTPNWGSAIPATVASVVSRSSESLRQRLVSARNAKRIRPRGSLPSCAVVGGAMACSSEPVVMKRGLNVNCLTRPSRRRDETLRPGRRISRTLRGRGFAEGHAVIVGAFACGIVRVAGITIAEITDSEAALDDEGTGVENDSLRRHGEPLGEGGVARSAKNLLAGWCERPAAPAFKLRSLRV